jgi:hypothetical protein
VNVFSAGGNVRVLAVREHWGIDSGESRIEGDSLLSRCAREATRTTAASAVAAAGTVDLPYVLDAPLKNCSSSSSGTCARVDDFAALPRFRTLRRVSRVRGDTCASAWEHSAPVATCVFDVCSAVERPLRAVPCLWPSCIVSGAADVGRCLRFAVACLSESAADVRSALLP